MSDLKRQVRDYTEATVERVDVNDVLATALDHRTIATTPGRPLKPAWAFALGALLVLVLGSVAWLLRADPGPSAVSVATCPPGTNPDDPGPVDRERPGRGPWSNQAAVFDQRTERVLYVDDAGETWTFDVCTNTWLRMNPEGTPYLEPEPDEAVILGLLVYDVDSDLTIAMGSDLVAVYDASTNAWTHRFPPGNLELDEFRGTVYDPVRGLVVAGTDSGGVVSYDVDTDRWSPLWGSESETGPGEILVGYIGDLDRLGFLGRFSSLHEDAGRLVDPRTGEFALLDSPPVGVADGFGSFKYASGGETIYTFADGGVCRLDPGTLGWTCIALPQSYGSQIPAAMVFDPINRRLVLINDWCCNWPGRAMNDAIWAIDFSTGEWTQLLAPSAPLHPATG